MATDGYKTAKALRRGEVEFWQRGDFTVTIIYSRLAPSGVKTKPGYIVSVIYLRNAPRQWFHDSLAEARAHFKVEVQDCIESLEGPPTYDELVAALRKVKSNGTRVRLDTRDLVNGLLARIDGKEG